MSVPRDEVKYYVEKDYTFADFKNQKEEYNHVYEWLRSIGDAKSMELPTKEASDALLRAIAIGNTRIVYVLTRLLKGESIVNRRIDLKEKGNGGFHDEDTFHMFAAANEFTPLLAAAYQNYWIVAAQLLKAPGIDVNATDKEGNTALHFAAKEGDEHHGLRKDTDAGNDVHCQLTKILLSAPGIEINKQNKKGETPLHIAARFAHLRTIKFLLAQDRIDTSIEDEGGKTALEIAQERQAKDINFQETVRMLLEAKEAQRPHSRE